MELMKMYASQIRKIIMRDRVMYRKFFGIYARDTLPTINPLTEGGYILNTDLSTNIGEHWVLAYCVPSTKNMLYIDPLGQQPPQTFKQWLKSTKYTIIQLKKPIQPLHSHLCGLYVLFYLYHLARKTPLRKITAQFSNDKVVVQFACKRFGFNACQKLYKDRLTDDFKLVCNGL